ncbi:hypothetical protein BCR44DRAFT_1429719 [Catenaria anguillulae PL171]|uniref:PH domain-containing protein n=1 Tax=Catenaria anguillulae PL171 TaxID=765915 RepID=A0A1Y2HST4_9FUNG|nr:hypothetical protein BCR44DRAFT_1429719 [Catenaria anguillulae PL171]
MRFNEADVAYFGSSPTSVTYRGWLWKRGDLPISSVPSFTLPPLATLYKKRWFVLKGNLLFYFHTPDDTVPAGFVLLEHCQVATGPVPAGMESQSEIPPYHMKISFLSESSRRTYELVAPTSEERLAWIQHLASASIDYLHNEIRYLKERVRQLDGGDHQATQPKSAAESSGTDNAATTDATRDLSMSSATMDSATGGNEKSSLMYTPGASSFSHALAFSLRVTMSLPISLPASPATGGVEVIISKDCYLYLALHQARGSSCTEWVPIKQFAATPFFTCLPANLHHETLLSLYLVQPSTFAELKLLDVPLDLRSNGGAGQHKITLQFDKVSLTIGTLLWTPLTIPPSSPQMSLALPAACEEQYYQLNDSTLIHESLAESPWAMHIPRMLLQTWIADEQRLIDRFTSLIPTAPDMHVIRLRQLDVHKQLMCYYREELEAVHALINNGAGKGQVLRKSVEKAGHKWQMVTLNCAVQRMKVIPPPAPATPPTVTTSTPRSKRSSMMSTATTGSSSSSSSLTTAGMPEASYSVVTFGAPAAHALGFPTSSATDPISGAAAAFLLGTSPSTTPSKDDPLLSSAAASISAQHRRDLGLRHAAFTDSIRTLQSLTLETFTGAKAQNVAALVTKVGTAAKDVATLVMAVASSLKDLDVETLGGFQAHVTEVGCQLVEEVIPLLAVRGQQLALLLDGQSFEAFAETLAKLADHVTLAHDSAVALLDHHMLLMDATNVSPSGWQTSRRRKDWVFSQMLGAIVTGLEETVRGWWVSDKVNGGAETGFRFTSAAWAQWVQVGWLAGLESLLSSQGDELGMLTDFRNALADVEDSVRVALHPVEDGESKAVIEWSLEDRIRISGERGDLIVSVGVPHVVYNAIPRRDAKARMHAVLFTQGINEQQTLSNVFGSGIKQQDAINRSSYSKLARYVATLREYVGTLVAQNLVGPISSRSFFEYVTMLVVHFDQILAGSEIKLAGVMSTIVDESQLSGGSSPMSASGSGSGGSGSGMSGAMGGLRRALSAVAGGSRAKNTDILVMAAHITRVLGSLHLLMAGDVEVHDRLPAFGSHPSTTTRFTSCKSAKDRSSMAVTLEQCFVLQAAHLMSPGDFEGMLTAMRACGTRIRNVEKNVGKPAYAFNALQWNILPRLYRPPKYTINQGAES